MTRKPLLPTVEKMWKDYSKSIYKDVNPLPVQVLETQKGFYAGALCMLMAAQAIGEEAVSEEEGIAYLQARQEELNTYFEDQIRKHKEKHGEGKNGTKAGG